MTFSLTGGADRYVISDDSDPTVEVPPSTAGSGSNWIWMVELARWDAALELGVGQPRLQPALQQHFREAQYHVLGPGGDRVGASLGRQVVGGSGLSSFHDSTFDCVTLQGVIGELAAVSPGADRADSLRQLFAECRRILRPGGCLYVGTGDLEAKPRRSWWTSLYGAGPLAVDQWLLQSGFRTVHSFLADPSLDRPFVIVPATRRSLRARDQALAACVGYSLRRALALRLGLARLLYGARICVAYT